MTDIIRIDRGGDSFDILAHLPDNALRLLRAFVEDVADAVDEEARERVPVDTGDLKENPFQRRDLKRRVQGPGGLVAKSEFSIAKRGKQRWVHNGTGIYGPKARPIKPRSAPFMVFEINGRKFRLKEVLGQEAQPYLEEAFDEIEARYIPARLAELRAELELLT